MSNFTSTINTRVQPKIKVQLTHEAEQRQLKLSQLVRLALAEWLAYQRGAGTPTTQWRHDGSSDIQPVDADSN